MHHFNKFKMKISLMVLLPLLVLSLSFLATSIYSISVNRNQIEHFSLATLESFSAHSENTILNAHEYISLFETQTDLLQMLKSSNVTLSDYDTSHFFKYLSNAEKSHSNVDSIIILGNDSDFVMTSSGIHSKADYFKNQYVYEDYNYEHWINLKFSDSSSSNRILSPTTVTSEKATTNIIPIICRYVGNTRIYNPVIINLNLDHIIKANEGFKYTENTNFYILNKYTGQVFGFNADNSTQNIFDSHLYKELIDGNHMFEYKMSDGEKYLISTYTTSNHILGYTYYSIVPNSDINNIQLPLLLVSIASITIFTLLTLLWAFRNTHQLSNPILKVVNLFENADEESSPESILNNLYMQTKNLIEDSSHLSVTLPFAQEKFLTDFLNSSSYNENTESYEFLKNSLPFAKKYFCSIIVCLYPTNEFYKSFNSLEYSNITYEFFNIVKAVFKENLDITSLPSDKETLYIIVNTDDPETSSLHISSALNKLHNLLRHDMELVELYTGIGKTYMDIQGLKQSHAEAIKSLKKLPTPMHISLSNSKSTINYIFNTTDETKLFSLLIGYKCNEAMNLIDKILAKNNNIDNRSLKQFYSQILSIVFRAMRTKNINYLSGSSSESELQSDILSLPPNAIYREIHILINKLQPENTNNASFDANTLIDFISDNYKNSMLSLEMIAARFNLNPTYCSTLLKNTLGTNFHEYVSTLRIDEAKNLLLNSSKTIQDIYTELGFTNRQTFIRSFKKNTGTTPTEFRSKKS